MSNVWLEQEAEVASLKRRISELEAEVDRLRQLLKVAECPCCDGEGAYYDNRGKVRQCQFCDEREEALKGGSDG